MRAREGGARGILTGTLRALAAAVVPPVCLGCQRRIEETDALCGDCWRQVVFIRPPLCDRLGLPLPFGPSSGTMISAAAAAEPPAWARARAAILYETGSIAARLLHDMKYRDRLDARGLFGRWLVEAGRELLAEADLIAPVPLTRWRLVQRQFNQAAILAMEVSWRTGVAWCPDALAKTRETPPQASLSGSARRENVRGAFAVPARRVPQVEGRRVVLLDDVITTGATAEAATKALVSAGAARVDVLAVARVGAPEAAAP